MSEPEPEPEPPPRQQARHHMRLALAQRRHAHLTDAIMARARAESGDGPDDDPDTAAHRGYLQTDQRRLEHAARMVREQEAAAKIIRDSLQAIADEAAAWEAHKAAAKAEPEPEAQADEGMGHHTAFIACPLCFSAKGLACLDPGDVHFIVKQGYLAAPHPSPSLCSCALLPRCPRGIPSRPAPAARPVHRLRSCRPQPPCSSR